MVNMDIPQYDERVMKAKAISVQLFRYEVLVPDISFSGSFYKKMRYERHLSRLSGLATFDGFFLSGHFTIFDGYLVTNFGSALGGYLGAIITGNGYLGAVYGLDFS